MTSRTKEGVSVPGGGEVDVLAHIVHDIKKTARFLRAVAVRVRVPCKEKKKRKRVVPFV